MSFPSTRPKNLTTAEGGAILWRLPGGERLHPQRFILLSLHGQNTNAWQRGTKRPIRHPCCGYKAKLSDLQSAIAFPAFALRTRCGAKRRIVDIFDDNIPVAGRPVPSPRSSCPSLHGIASAGNGGRRDTLQRDLQGGDSVQHSITSHCRSVPPIGNGLLPENFPNALSLWLRSSQFPYQGVKREKLQVTRRFQLLNINTKNGGQICPPACYVHSSTRATVSAATQSFPTPPEPF